MAGYLSDVEEVRRIVCLYNDGANGDVSKLKEAFHPDCWMMGQIEPYNKKTYVPI
jgi:glutathione S-transferase